MSRDYKMMGSVRKYTGIYVSGSPFMGLIGLIDSLFPGSSVCQLLSRAHSRACLVTDKKGDSALADVVAPSYSGSLLT